MKETPCKISASHLFPIVQTPEHTRVLLSPILKLLLKILTQKDSGFLILNQSAKFQSEILTLSTLNRADTAPYQTHLALGRADIEEHFQLIKFTESVHYNFSMKYCFIRKNYTEPK
jgi:hypothetical protein